MAFHCAMDHSNNINLNTTTLINNQTHKKHMKKVLFIAMALLVVMSSCTIVRQTCPSTDPNFFYKEARVKPFYYKR